MPDAEPRAIHRRAFFDTLAQCGLGAGLFPGALWTLHAQAQDTAITPAMIAEAERIAGLAFTDDERTMMAKGLEDLRESYQAIRRDAPSNDVSPAYLFHVPAPETGITNAETAALEYQPTERPANDADLPALSIRELGALLRQGDLTSAELTNVCIAQLKKYDPVLHCVVTLTEDRARAQAEQADRELVNGNDRGPLHGIPWGAKDLLAVKGYPTTWGAAPFKTQTFDYDAAVVQRLDAAGAVLVAKLSLGALAMGDVWYKERTRNPWNPEHGSSGSSAGSAAAVAAGCIPFALGSETYGSIISPCTRCGVTGLRPTFGRVSRHGAMALAWTLDKLGPIARYAEDCALVFAAIHGRDLRDPSTTDAPFHWQPRPNLEGLRIGAIGGDESDFAAGPVQEFVDVLRKHGATFEAMELPQGSVDHLAIILDAEAAAAFDTFTRDNTDDQLTRQTASAWPNQFRKARFIPAVEYIQANRIRRTLMEALSETLRGYDAYLAPTFHSRNLLLTNLTGHPALVLPTGFTDKNLPTSVTLCAPHHHEQTLVTLAHAYQQATHHHKTRPDLPELLT